MLTDVAEAAFEHLIDRNPSVPTLFEHLDLLQNARVHGIGQAYAAQAEDSAEEYAIELADGLDRDRTWPGLAGLRRGTSRRPFE